MRREKARGRRPHERLHRRYPARALLLQDVGRQPSLAGRRAPFCRLVHDVGERSRSSLAVKAIGRYLALNAWQIDKVEAGIAAADRGEFADDDDVARVVEKYSAQG